MVASLCLTGNREYDDDDDDDSIGFKQQLECGLFSKSSQRPAECNRC